MNVKNIAAWKYCDINLCFCKTLCFNVNCACFLSFVKTLSRQHSRHKSSYWDYFNNRHCLKTVQIRSCFWFVFSGIWTEYGDLTPYLDTFCAVMIKSTGSIQMCSYKRVFWKYAANLLENTHAEVGFWSHFSMGVLLKICCVFSEHLFNQPNKLATSKRRKINQLSEQASKLWQFQNIKPFFYIVAVWNNSRRFLIRWIQLDPLGTRRTLNVYKMFRRRGNRRKSHEKIYIVST